jgi:hypothetical protein
MRSQERQLDEAVINLASDEAFVKVESEEERKQPGPSQDMSQDMSQGTLPTSTANVGVSGARRATKQLTSLLRRASDEAAFVRYTLHTVRADKIRAKLSPIFARAEERGTAQRNANGTLEIDLLEVE